MEDLGDKVVRIVMTKIAGTRMEPVKIFCVPFIITKSKLGGCDTTWSHYTSETLLICRFSRQATILTFTLMTQ
jgi:hypothetical protein